MRVRRRHSRKATQQCPQPQVLQFALLRPETVLQRLASVEHEQDAALRQSFRDGIALGGRACCVDRDAEPSERPVEERFGRGRALL
jgi:hypothetical protein